MGQGTLTSNPATPILQSTSVSGVLNSMRTPPTAASAHLDVSWVLLRISLASADLFWLPNSLL